jgi:hypothetical protein
MANENPLWKALTKAGDFVYNVGEKAVDERLKVRVEVKLKPFLKLLEDPKARRAPDKARFGTVYSGIGGITGSSPRITAVS